MFIFWQILFWLCVVLVFHTYVFYPLLIKRLSLHRSLHFPDAKADKAPLVSIIVSAFNEESVIAEKIESVYRSAYPSHKFELLIGSDNSTDSTNTIVETYAQKYSNLHFVAYTQRRGKQNVVNDLVKLSKGSILILTDANVIFHPNTIEELAKPFEDDNVGLVDSKMVNRGQKVDGISEQETAYISREVMIKHCESILWGSMMGPFGGCYAIRKSLYNPVPPNALVDDFYINMKILEQGKKCVNNLSAIVFEDVSNDIKIEMRRKIRIATGNFQNLRWFSSLLLPPWRGRAFAFWSHKVLRWITPFFIIAALLVSVVLINFHPIYTSALVIQLLLMLFPFLDALLKTFSVHNKFLRFISHFYAMNLALFIGFFRAIKGVKSGVWTVTKRKQ